MKARSAILRSLLLYGPLFLGAAVLEAIAVAQPFAGGSLNIVGLVLLTPIFLLLAWHTVNLVQDLASRPVTREIAVQRKWSRLDLPFGRSFYIYDGRTVFKIPQAEWAQLLHGDRLSITYLPHTAAVESLRGLPDSGRKGVGP